MKDFTFQTDWRFKTASLVVQKNVPLKFFITISWKEIPNA